MPFQWLVEICHEYLWLLNYFFCYLLHVCKLKDQQVYQVLVFFLRNLQRFTILWWSQYYIQWIQNIQWMHIIFWIPRLLLFLMFMLICIQILQKTMNGPKIFISTNWKNLPPIAVVVDNMWITAYRFPKICIPSAKLIDSSTLKIMNRLLFMW